MEYERYGPKGFQGELDEFARFARQMITDSGAQSPQERCVDRGPCIPCEISAGGAERDVASARRPAGRPAEGLLPTPGRTGSHRAAVQRRRDASVRRDEGHARHRRAAPVAERRAFARSADDQLRAAARGERRRSMSLAGAVAALSSPAATPIAFRLQLPSGWDPRHFPDRPQPSASGRTVDTEATGDVLLPRAVMWGDAGPVRYLLRPVRPDAPAPGGAGPRGDDALRVDLLRRLKSGDVEFELAAQRFVSEDTTPVENVSKPWRGPDGPVGLLAVPEQVIDTAGRGWLSARSTSWPSTRGTLPTPSGRSAS